MGSKACLMLAMTGLLLNHMLQKMTSFSLAPATRATYLQIGTTLVAFSVAPKQDCTRANSHTVLSTAHHCNSVLGTMSADHKLTSCVEPGQATAYTV